MNGRAWASSGTLRRTAAERSAVRWRVSAADGEHPVVRADVVELLHPPEIDRTFGRARRMFIMRHEALAAGEHLRVVTVLGEPRQRLVERARRRIVEDRGFHRGS